MLVFPVCVVRTFTLFRPCIWQSLLVRLGVACGVQSLDFREILVLLVRNAWFDSGYMFCGSLGVVGRITHNFYVDVDSDFEAFFLRSHEEWRSMLSRCFSLSLCTRCSPLKSGQYFYESMCWNLRDDEGHFSRSVRIFRTSPQGVESPRVANSSQRLVTKTSRLKMRQKQQQ